MNRLFHGLAVFGAVILLASSVHAQQPFQNIQQAPTVSPYLNLSLNNGRGNTNYQSLVRPQIEQQQTNQQTERQIQHLSNQQRALTLGGLTQPARGVAANIRGTGHIAGFMVQAHYFPQAQMTTNDPITRRLVTMNYNQ